MFSSILPISLLALTASTTVALSCPPFARQDHSANNAISDISLPASALPPPASTMSLKYVVVGHGTQNYTCASTPNSATASPAPAGAVATLYDASGMLSAGSAAAKAEFETILPPLILSVADAYGTDPDDLPMPIRMPAIGHHFFAPTAAAAVPTFNLHHAQPPAQIACKKVADVPAPAGSFAGLSGEGAVHWLQLVDNASGYAAAGSPLSGGDVYRVETAGGAAPATCIDHAAGIQVPYAALYFFYGPATA